MRTTLLFAAYFWVTLFAAAAEKTTSNAVANPKASAATTNEVAETAEQRLTTFFPQLSWARRKLEFVFEKRAGIAPPLAAGGNSDAEALKLAKEMESVFREDGDVKMFTEGWKMSGRVHSQTVNYSKPNYTLAGIVGEIQLLYDRDTMISFSFWTDGSDTDFAKLYKVLVGACSSPGQRVINGKDDSEIKWTVLGGTNHYDIVLSHSRFQNKLENAVVLERGMTIFIKHPLKPTVR